MNETSTFLLFARGAYRGIQLDGEGAQAKAAGDGWSDQPLEGSSRLGRKEEESDPLRKFG